MSTNCEIPLKPKTIKEYFKSWYFWKRLLGVVLGGTGGFLYYYFIGCNTGTCAITSSPFGSILMGSLLGYLILSSPCLSFR